MDHNVKWDIQTYTMLFSSFYTICDGRQDTCPAQITFSVRSRTSTSGLWYLGKY